MAPKTVFSELPLSVASSPCSRRPCGFSPLPARGFTLVEALVATAIVATAAVVLAHLVALGTTQTTNARASLEALVAAQSKLEELRAVTWSHSVPGSDLPISPPGSLSRDVAGYQDRAASFVRRWSVARRDAADPDVVVINVCVFALSDAPPPEACVSTIRARRP